VDARVGHVARADEQRDQIGAERPGQQRHHGEKDHDGAVHGDELVVELRRHVSARRVGSADHRRHESGHGRRGPRQLPAHHQHQHEADQQEAERRHEILQGDGLVMGEVHAVGYRLSAI
jgi:hypothetical protein